MIPPSGNSHSLETFEACAFVADREHRRWLAPFLRGECTVSSAARELGVSSVALYKRVRRAVELGILTETCQQPRAGKPLRFYRARGESLFIPFRLYPPDLLHAANRALYQDAFVHALERLYREAQFVESGMGARTAVAPSGDVYLQIVTVSGETWDYLARDAPALAVGWNPMWLEPEDAKALQREIVGVLGKYLGKRGSRAYLTGMFLCDAHLELGLPNPRLREPCNAARDAKINPDKTT